MAVSSTKTSSKAPEKIPRAGAERTAVRRTALGRRVIQTNSTAPVANADTVEAVNVLVNDRINDFSAESWWMVDLESYKGRQGATHLVRRCMVEYVWDGPKAKQVLKAYRQFLTLKKELQDWNATILSPSILVDMMWHMHVLDVINYVHDCIILCGRLVGYNPDGKLNPGRIVFTKRALEERFGQDYDADVWTFSIDRPRTSRAANQRPHFDGTSFPVLIKMLTGVSFTVWLNTFSRIRTLKDIIEDLKGVPIAQLRLLYNGKELEDAMTVRECGIGEESTIHLVLRLRGF